MSLIETKCIACGQPFVVNFPEPAPLDVERLYRAMCSLDADDPGVFNIVGISEPDTRPVAEALAREYTAITERSRP